MNNKIKIVFEYTTPHYANIAYNSLHPDNENIVKSEVIDNKLICYTEHENINTVLNTVEDLIHCEKIVESTSKIV